MRKYHKKLILEMMGSLLQANRELKDYINKADTNSLTNLLADEQDVIENVNNFLSSYENISEEVISELVSYYQLLFEMHNTPSLAVLNKMETSLQSLTYSIQSKVVANKIEAVFLPYSAAMFDSLESVWNAAKEDSDCDAYLIPIPYYSKDKSGKLDQMKYDGDYYKGRYNITYWSDYDIKSRHPDIIYIHNPYDDCNYITSVHPDYYSRELKKHTELLVYIPYFITRNNLEINFSTPPATAYADRVFVQSDQDRAIYIENHYKRYSIDAKTAQERFVAIGSPKVDKVLNCKKNEYTLPEKWKMKIIKSDGDSKKIILYITSLAPMLSAGIEYIKKIQSVFTYFSQRDDVVLWWRPHPLTNETYSSMRPHLQDIYGKITRLYREADIGIYDDTPDLHRAIVYSDAYYGDISSVAGLYGFTDKLIIYQTIEIQNYNNNSDDSFAKMLKRLVGFYENNAEHDVNLYLIWEAVENRLPLLIEYLKEKNKPEYLEQFLNGRKRLYEKLSICNDGKTGKRIYENCKHEVLK